MLGRELQDLFPLAFLPQHHALAIAIMSYNGGLDYGLLGDYDAMPDIDLVAEGIEASLAQLLAAARGAALRLRRATAARGGQDGRRPRVGQADRKAAPDLQHRRQRRTGADRPARPRPRQARSRGRHARQARARRPSAAKAPEG